MDAGPRRHASGAGCGRRREDWSARSGGVRDGTATRLSGFHPRRSVAWCAVSDGPPRPSPAGAFRASGTWPKKIDRGAIESALTLDFLREGRNFIVLGSNGLGKTMILKNIAHQAVLDGHSVLVRTASDMLDDLDSDSPELRRQRLRKYFRPKLLCIDELGYLSYDENAADLLFHVVNPRYDARRSIVLTTNLAFKDWNTVFPNATCIATLLDRLTHHADVTVLEGKSYRVRESEQENDERKQRRRQKKAPA